MTEHQIQKSIVELLRLHNIPIIETDVMSGLQFFSHKDPRRYAFINHHKSMGYMPGQSDLILITDNVVFVEVKTPKGKQSKEQKNFQKYVEEKGYVYLIWQSIEDARKFIKKRVAMF